MLKVYFEYKTNKWLCTRTGKAWKAAGVFLICSPNKEEEFEPADALCCDAFCVFPSVCTWRKNVLMRKKRPLSVLRSSVRYHTAELGFVVPLVTRHFICVLEPEVLFSTAFLFCVLEWMCCLWNPLFFIDVIAIRFDSICRSVTFSVEFFFCFLASLCLHCNREALEWFLFSWGWKGEPFARLGSLVSGVFVISRQKRLFCKVRELSVSHPLQGR